MSASSASFSLAICGDGSVGKSSITQSMKNGGFSPIYRQTLGIDFYEKVFKLRGDRLVTLRVWDVGGQSISSNSLPKYLSGADAIFLVYDVTNAESYGNLDDWLDAARCHSKARFIYLVGNKIDLISSRQVSESQHFSFITQNSMAGGIFLSAKSGENLIKSFYKVAGELTGTPLSASELESYDQVLNVAVTLSGDDEGRTAFADQIEAEDLAAMQRANQGGCNCAIS